MQKLISILVAFAACANATQLSDDPPINEIVLAGLVYDAGSITQNVLDFIVDMSCSKFVRTSIVTASGSESFGARYTITAEKKYQQQNCAKVSLVKDPVLNRDESMNRVKRIQFLREFQKEEIRKNLSKNHDLDSTTIILADFDLDKLPAFDKVVKNVESLQDHTSKFDVLCSNGISGNGANSKRYHDTSSTVLLPDTFVHPIELREIAQVWPYEDSRFIIDPEGNAESFTSTALFNWFEEKGRENVSKKLQSNPVPVRSCFGGLALYKASRFFDGKCSYMHQSRAIKNAKYRNSLDNEVSEHILWNNCMQAANESFVVAVQPNMITTSKTETEKVDRTSRKLVSPTDTESVLLDTSSPTESSKPSIAPSGGPTVEHSDKPTLLPTETISPTANPTPRASSFPTEQTAFPSSQPSQCEDSDNLFYYGEATNEGVEKLRPCSFLYRGPSGRDAYCAMTDRGASSDNLLPMEACRKSCGVCGSSMPSSAPSVITSSPSISSPPSKVPSVVPSSQPSICQDSSRRFFTGTFKLNGQPRLRLCHWLKTSPEGPDYYCGLTEDDKPPNRPHLLLAIDACRVTCGVCDPPSSVPTSAPSSISDSPSQAPSDVPSNKPSDTPSKKPTQIPSDVPSEVPTEAPSTAPSQFPSDVPSEAPSTTPSQFPSDVPSEAPSTAPSQFPSDVPSEAPSTAPSQFPSDVPSEAPSTAPSQFPSDVPSEAPSSAPSQFPSDVPSEAPSSAPSQFPSDVPSTAPSTKPSQLPSDVPSTAPSQIPSEVLSETPSTVPSAKPSPATDVCVEVLNDKFYWKVKEGEEVFKKCSWLKEKSQSLRDDICEMVEPTDKDLAKDVCPVTCGTCPTAAPSVAPSTVPSTVPSAKPSPATVCEEVSSDKFFLKVKEGEEVFKKCSWLEEQSQSRKDGICEMVEPTDKDLAKDVCPVTCGTCD